MNLPSKKKRRTLTLVGYGSALLVIVFATWIIHEANVGRDNILFQTVRATPHGDKIGHVILASLLTVVVTFLTRVKCVSIAHARIPLGSLIVLVLVVAEELSQYFLPTRSLDIYDALANLLGIFLGSLPFIVYDRKRRQRAVTEKG